VLAKISVDVCSSRPRTSGDVARSRGDADVAQPISRPAHSLGAKAYELPGTP